MTAHLPLNEDLQAKGGLFFKKGKVNTSHVRYWLLFYCYITSNFQQCKLMFAWNLTDSIDCVVKYKNQNSNMYLRIEDFRSLITLYPWLSLLIFYFLQAKTLKHRCLLHMVHFIKFILELGLFFKFTNLTLSETDFWNWIWNQVWNHIWNQLWNWVYEFILRPV